MLIKINGRIVNMPDFLCIGAGKSGTTSLYFYLKEHPEIFLPEIKEIRFFHCVDSPPLYMNQFPEVVCEFEKYVKLFDKAKNKKCGDISPQYLYYHNVTINNIKKYHPGYKKLKFIVIIRQPLERIVSQYVMNIEKGLEFLSFDRAIEKEKERLLDPKIIPALHYLNVSLYYKQLKAYIEEFGLENVKIYLFEEFKGRLLWVLQDIFSFLEINPDFIPRNLKIRYNVSGIPKSKIHKFFYESLLKINKYFKFSRFVSQGIKDYLKFWIAEKIMIKPKITINEQIFEYLKKNLDEDIKKLEELIKKDLSSWRNWTIYYEKYVKRS